MSLVEKTIKDVYNQKLVDEICADVEKFFNEMVFKYNNIHLEMCNVTLHMMSMIFTTSIIEQYKVYGDKGLNAFVINQNSIAEFFKSNGIGVEVVPPKSELS